MSIITVDQTKCNACGICTKACPLSLIDQNTSNQTPQIEASKEARCIACGHCESICPQSALIHQLSEQAQLSAIEGNPAVSQSALSAHFKNRRSIRNFQSRSIDTQTFEQIFDIVRYSPTGTNRQFNEWVVISNKSVISQLTEGTINWMRTMTKVNPEMAQRVNFPALIASFEAGADRICRNAPHIVVCHTNVNYPLGVKDACIATAHLELALPSFGIGGCWAGYLMLALQYSAELKAVIGLNETNVVHTALMLGYPKQQYYKTPQRKPASIQWI